MKNVNVCPFRVITKTEKCDAEPGVTYSSQIFAPCLKYGCPAYHRRQGAYDKYEETCLMIGRGKVEG